MGSVPRSVWIDDSGSNQDGTVIANSELQKIYDNVNLETLSTHNPTIPTYQAIDAVMAVGGFYFGGDAGRYRRNVGLPAGATYDILAPGTGIWRVDPGSLTGTWKLEAVLRVEPGAGAGVTASLAMVNLTDSSDVAMAGTTITSTSQTGQLVRSGTITIAGSGATKDFGIKIWTSDANYGANAAFVRFYKG